jgi:hypothetical protein
MTAIEALVTRNTLSPLLISPYEMKKLFNKVRRLLQKHHPNFEIAVKNIGFMYRTPGVAYTWDENNLYVQIRIPVAAYDSRYLVYRPYAISLPITEEQSHTLTQVSELPDLFAVSMDHSFYFELTQNELNNCVGKHDRYCLYAFPVISNDVPSCISSIFWNQYVQAKNTCEVLYIQTQEPTRLLQPISSHTYLSIAQPGDDWYLSCGRRGPKHMDPVVFGKFQLPCGCSLRTNKYFLPPNIDGCNYTTTSDITVQRLHNIMYLTQWLDDKQTQDLYDQSETNVSALIRELPLPNISSPDFGSGYLDPNQDIILNLKDVIQQSQTSKRLQHHLISDMINQITDNSRHSATKSILTFLVIGVAVAALVFTVIIYKRFTNTKSIIAGALATALPQVSAQTPKLTMHSTTQICASMPDVLYIVIFTLLIVIAIFLAANNTVKFYLRITKFFLGYRYVTCPTVQEPLQILLEITNSHKTVYVPLRQIATSPGSLLIKDPHLSVVWDNYANCLNPHITIRWHHSQLQIIPQGTEVILPIAVPVPWIAARQIKQMIKMREVRYGLLAGLNGKYTYVSVHSPALEQTACHMFRDVESYNFENMPTSSFHVPLNQPPGHSDRSEDENL